MKQIKKLFENFAEKFVKFSGPYSVRPADKISCFRSRPVVRAVIRSMVLIVAVFTVSSVFGDNFVADDPSSVNKSFESVWSFMDDIRGNAIWDFVKLLVVWGVKLVLASALLFIVVVSLFSQRLHVSLFIKGSWRGLFWFSGVKDFGRLVRKNEISEYRKFNSSSRRPVIDSINKHSGVFIVMGPQGVGKSLLVQAESRQGFVLAIDREDWYDQRRDEMPVKAVLKDRTTLLVRHLIGFCRKPVRIVLLWNPTIAMPLPSKDRLEKIVAQLLGILSAHGTKFRKVSFVLTIPSYYQIDSPQFDEKRVLPPELHQLYFLDSAECLSLLEAQLRYKEDTARDFNALEYRRKLENKARDKGISLERMLWIGSLGKPKQVVEIVARMQYESPEVWKSLRDWWKQVYDAGCETDGGKDDWLAYLYVIALKSLVDGPVVDAEFLAKKLFGKKAGSALDAVKRMCCDRRPSTREKGLDNPFVRVSARREGRLDLRKVDATRIFEDRYVIECLVGSLGEMEDKSSLPPIFYFSEKMREAVQAVFDLEDNAICEKLAASYMTAVERIPELSRRLEEQYGFVARLKNVFGDCRLVDSYRHRLRDPLVFQEFVGEVVGRIGVLPEYLLDDLFDGINQTLLKNLSVTDYAALVFELLPAFVISYKLPHRWGVDFATLVEGLDSPAIDENVKFRCASIVCAAHIEYALQEKCVQGRLFDDPDIKNHYELIKAAFERVECSCKNEWYWSVIKEDMAVVSQNENDNCGNGFVLCRPIPSSVLFRTRLVILCYKIYFNTFESMDNAGDVADSLLNFDGSALNIIDQFLLSFCQSRIPFSYYIEGDEDIDNDRLKAFVDRIMRSLEQWSGCPAIATMNLRNLCDGYMHVLKRRQTNLSNINLWEILGVLRRWQNDLNDCWYSDCLSSYANLLSCISNSDIDTNLQIIWKDFAEIAKVFWKPILSGNVEVSDWTMPKNYFELFMSLSNVKTIPPSVRRQLLKEIQPSEFILLCPNIEPVECAWCIYDCDSDLVPAHIKMFWCIEIMTGMSCELLSRDSAGYLQAAEKLIAEARNDGVPFDEELIQLLYEANGS